MNKLLSHSCLAALACLSACSSMAPYPGQAIEDDAEQATNVVVSSTRLHRDLRFGRASVKRVEGTNQLKVIVPIRNVGDDGLQVLVLDVAVHLFERRVQRARKCTCSKMFWKCNLYDKISLQFFKVIT